MRFDYDKAADTYDLHRRGGGPFVGFLCELARASSAEHVLEIGPGTGNNTQAFLDAYPCALVGLDLSRGMIARAARKVPEAHWVQGDAAHMPFAAQSMEFVFAVLVLHHIHDIAPVLAECARVLRRGYAAFVTSPHDFIDRHPMNRYFPSFAPIDKNRFQSVDHIERLLREAGFHETGARRIIGPPQPIDRKYLAAIEGKFLSTYSLMPPEEYERGLARLRADIETHGRLDIEMRWESVTVWGRR